MLTLSDVLLLPPDASKTSQDVPSDLQDASKNPLKRWKIDLQSFIRARPASPWLFDNFCSNCTRLDGHSKYRNHWTTMVFYSVPGAFSPDHSSDVDMQTLSSMCFMLLWKMIPAWPHTRMKIYLKWALTVVSSWRLEKTSCRRPKMPPKRFPGASKMPPTASKTLRNRKKIDKMV